MHPRTTRRGRRLLAAAATSAAVALPLFCTTVTAEAEETKPPSVSVMTRNIYLGANIMRPIAAVQQAQAEGGGTLDIIDAFANANHATRGIVDETDFRARAELLASELVDKKPDLVGLQEVALWRSGPFENPAGPNGMVSNATNVDLDFLAILLAELKAQGEPYRALSVNSLSDVEGPAYEGTLGTRTNDRDVRLTMRDVIIMRKGSTTVSYVKGSARKKTYDTKLSVAVSGKTFDFDRGYQSVDMVAGTKEFRFVNTHLEAFGSDLSYAQAGQVLREAGGHKGTTILVCDCNSDPVDGTLSGGKRHWAPYKRILRAGFHDTWLQRYAPEDGFTSGLSETVEDEDASGFDHRIDFVFARTANGFRLPVVTGDVTGDEVGDRDETGRWPSDHAGVFMKLRLR